MELPQFIYYVAEKMGKPVSAFTKDDWKRTAIAAAEFYDRTIPASGKRGRPKKYRPENTIAWLLGTERKKPKRGRPIQLYGKKQVPIAVVSRLIDAVLSKESRKKWPKEAPGNQIAAARSVLKAIEHPTEYAESVLRSVRHFRKKTD